MDIRIKKCSGGEWYGQYIGKVFTVEDRFKNKVNNAMFFVQIKDRRIRRFTKRDIMSVWINDVEIME